MRRTRGFTMAEILVTISLMLLGLSAVFINVHHRTNQGAGELAKVIVNELRQARRRAQATGSPRAFCIPTANATTPCAQSYYLMSGHGKTAPRLVTDTSQQYAGVYLFVGLWSSAPQSLPNSAGSTLVAANWMNPVVRDFIFLFNRDGHLVTNDLPRDPMGNSYIIVSDGLDFASASPPSGTPTTGTNPPPYFQLSRVNKPWIIRISPSGIASLSNIMLNPASGLSITADQPLPPSLLPAPPAVVPALNSPPVVTGLDGVPKASTLYNPPFETTIPPDGRVSMSLLAYDPDGEDLSYQFSSTPNTGSDGGKFTYFDALRYLNYPNPAVNQGQTRSDWVPPYGVAPGSTFQLKATVTDERGNSTSNTANINIDVKITQDGIITFDSSNHIWTMQGDGTLAQNIMPGGSWPELSPDGRNIVFVSSRNVSYSSTLSQTVPRIWLMATDGSGLRRLTGVDTSSAASITATKNTADGHPCWSPDGSKILFERTDTASGVSQLQIISGSGSWIKQNLAIGSAGAWSPVMPSTGKDILYENGGDLYATDTSGNTGLLVNNALAPTWSNDGTRFLYLDNTSRFLFEAKSDGSSATPKCSYATGRVDFNSRGTNFVGVSASIPYMYTDPGQGSGATQQIPALRAAALPGGFDGHISWGAVR